MGLTTSTVKNNSEEEKLNNIKKLFNNINEGDADDILESLDITEFKKDDNVKKPIPMVGGFGYSDDEEVDSAKLPRRRYTKYDLFRMLKDLESDLQTGGGDDDDNNNVDSSLDDEKSMDNIKRVILKELQNLKENKSQQLGGVGCDCNTSKENNRKAKLNMNNVVVEGQFGGNVIVDDSSSSTSSSSSDSDEAGKYQKKSKKKSKSTNKKYDDDEDKKTDNDDDDESSRFFIQASDSNENGMTSNSSVKKNSYKKKTNKKSKKNSSKQNFSEDSEGLSIFPFNSSDVKSSQSIQNFRTLRRRI